MHSETAISFWFRLKALLASAHRNSRCVRQITERAIVHRCRLTRANWISLRGALLQAMTRSSIKTIRNSRQGNFTRDSPISECVAESSPVSRHQDAQWTRTDERAPIRCEKLDKLASDAHPAAPVKTIQQRQMQIGRCKLADTDSRPVCASSQPASDELLNKIKLSKTGKHKSERLLRHHEYRSDFYQFNLFVMMNKTHSNRETRIHRGNSLGVG